MAGTELRIRRRSLTRLLLANVLALVLAGVMPAVHASGQRVASINLCADVLLLHLLPREQIASVSWLAAVSPLSPVRALAAGIPVNHAKVEELLVQRPDMVVARRGHARATVARLGERGIAIHEMSVPGNWHEARREWLALGKALAAEKEAEALVRRMQERLSALPKRDAKAPTAVIIGPGAYTYGKGTLAHDLLRLAGWDNLAGYVLNGPGGVMPLEALVLGRPDLIISERSPDDFRLDTLGDQQMLHPLLQNQTAAAISLPSSAWACGGPEAMDAIESLAAARTGRIRH